ncbi:MAG: hypothetical protein E6H55_00845 [Betaproteobacteria bacterium]|nr:MAG: hypothetical protein E6H55_00845 [Betaproteobacteria bacterium]
MNRAQPQRGWIGIIGLLLALVIVALLAQTVLKTYGLLPGRDAAVEAGPRGVGAVGPAPADVTIASPPAAAPIERARGVERQLQRDAQDLARRIDESAK